EVATVRGVSGVVRVVQLAGTDDDLAHAEKGGKATSLHELRLRIGLGICGGQDRAVAQGVLRRPAKQRGVHAAREREDPPLHVPDDVDEPRILHGGRGFHAQRSKVTILWKAAYRCSISRASSRLRRSSEKSSTANEAMT